MAKKKTIRQSSKKQDSVKRNRSSRSRSANLNDLAADVPSTSPFGIVSRGDISGSAFDLRDESVEQALISGEDRDLLEAYFGEAQYEELTTLARDSQRTRAMKARVLLLPGIMGSKLGKKRKFFFDDCIWLDFIDVITGNLKKLAIKSENSKIIPIGVILFAYLRLKLNLRIAGYDVSFYPFDWRKPIGHAGSDLANKIIKESTQSKHNKRGIHLVAHSMGGLVSRAAIKILEEKNQGHLVRQLLMMGTPNYGSFSPVLALRGTHSIIQTLARLDQKHNPEELSSNIFNSFPGLCEMLPARSVFPDIDFFDAKNWPSSPRVRPNLLKDAADLESQLAPGDSRFKLIAGINQETIISCRRDGDDYEYTYGLAGDGTVPLDFARLPGVDTYYVEEKHGSLPNNTRVIRSVIDLIETGQTDELTTSWTPHRSSTKIVPESEFRVDPLQGRSAERLSQAEVRSLIQEFAAPLGLPKSITAPQTQITQEFSQESIIVGRRRQHRLNIQIANGDIAAFNSRAIVLGVFKDVTPTGPAAAINEHLNNAIGLMTERRMFSGDRGELFIVPTGRHALSTDMVILAGLGSYDTFTLNSLELVAENIARSMAMTNVEDFATVIFGTGSGIKMGSALKMIITGFFRGMKDVENNQRVHTITLCEYDSEQYRLLKQEILHLAMTPLFDEVEVTLDEIPLSTLHTPIRTIPRDLTLEKDPDYLIVRTLNEKTLQCSLLTADGKATIITDIAEINPSTLNNHLKLLINDKPDDLCQFGNTLAKMVLPETIHQILSRRSERHLVIIHDLQASRIPWETIYIKNRALALSGLSRKLDLSDMSMARWMNQRQRDEKLRILLITNPTKDLIGAEQEGDRMKAIMAKFPSTDLVELRGDKATLPAIQMAFESENYDIVHFAGHAYFDPDDRASCGLICANNQVLRGKHLSDITALPSLISFNACESGRVRKLVAGKKVKSISVNSADMLETNASIAESMLRGGVANFIGTYWPVGDAAALLFGETFYTKLMQGATIGDAVVKGRKAVFKLKDNHPTMATIDWADYIHYGSWKFKIKIT